MHLKPLLLSLLVGSTVASHPKPRIFGGQAAPTMEEFAFSAAIYYRKDLACGGIVLSPTWILTAAHCLYDIGADHHPGQWNKTDPSKLFVSAGSLGLAPEASKMIPVKQMVMDSRFSPINTRYDVALLELDMPLGLSDTLHPIPILQPQVNLTFPEDVRLRAVGWGQTEQSRLSQTLMVTELRQPPMEYCAKGLPDLMGPDESIRIEWVCAASPKPDLGGHDTCFGDSGGALIASSTSPPGPPIIAGLTSFGINVHSFSSTKCAAPGAVGIYSQVGMWVPWISSITGIPEVNLFQGTWEVSNGFGGPVSSATRDTRGWVAGGLAGLAGIVISRVVWG